MMYKLIIIGTLTLAGIFYFQKAKAQFPKVGSCKNLAFDQKVNGYLSYSAPVMDVDDAYDKQNDFLFLDAREIEEYKVSHIKGAKHIGYDHFALSTLNSIPKNKNIIVYCSIGYRSEKIANKLRKAGYQNTYNLYGSIFEWVNRGYPVFSAGQEVKKVHTYNQKWGKWVMNNSYKKVYK
ncbi:MAG: rhodanese-like domain-containing protein [Saprospiraceae bacterium]|nr:rhodanese-like domain-containing protein [Saprospiraceae bacterium]